MAGCHLPAQGAAVAPVDLLGDGRVVERDAVAIAGELPRRRVTDNDRCGRVGEHPADPLARLAGIDGDERAPGLPRAEHRDDRVSSPLQADRDARFRRRRKGAQEAGQLVRSPVQLREAQRRPLMVDHRDGRGTLGGAALDQPGDASGAAVLFEGRPVPVQLPALFLGQELEREDGVGRTCQRLLQESNGSESNILATRGGANAAAS